MVAWFRDESPSGEMGIVFGGGWKKEGLSPKKRQNYKLCLCVARCCKRVKLREKEERVGTMELKEKEIDRERNIETQKETEK